MDCEGYEVLAVDLLYGELSPERHADAAAHAASCAECGKLSKELDEARRTAAALPARIAPPRELDERVLLAARAAADVRAQPIRGSALHVAAAAVLAMVLVGVSFAVGVRSGRPRELQTDEGPLPSRNPGSVGIVDMSGPPRIVSNVPIDVQRQYMEDMLKLAGDDFAKGDWKRALMEFQGVYASGGRSGMALDARLGMARCSKALGQLDDAKTAANDARTKNQEWGYNDNAIEDESTKLVREINALLEKRLR